MSDVLRVAELAGLLGCSVSRVYQLLEMGELPSCRVGGAIVVMRPAYETWLAERTAISLEAAKQRRARDVELIAA